MAVVIWSRDPKPATTSYTRIVPFGVEVTPAAVGYRADLFWSWREYGGPNVGFYASEGEAMRDAPYAVAELLRNADFCACNYTSPCHRHAKVG